MAKTEEDLKQIREKGEKAYRAGDYEKAIELFELFIEERPNFADVLNMLGLSYHQLNRMEDAIQAFEKALELNPRYTEVGINLAVTLFDIGRYDQARAVQEKIQSEAEVRDDDLDPYAMKKLANMHMELGDAYHAIGLHDQALEEYTKALHLAPAFPDVRTKLADTYRDKGRLDEAIEQLKQVKEANPQYIPARLSLGITYYSKCLISEAREEWRQILGIDPSNKGAKAYLQLVRPDTVCE